MSVSRGEFVTIEGIEGTGKSTNLQYVAEWLKSQGRSVVTTREPGGTPLAEEIREVLLKTREEAVAVDAELLLMFAARAQHLNELVWPCLEKGIDVLSDRFTDATYAYQGGGRGIALERIAQLETFVQGSFRPSLTILLTIDPVQGMARALARGELDRFESEAIDFYHRVQNCYLARAARDAHRYLVIDASRELSAVQRDILDGLTDRFCN